MLKFIQRSLILLLIVALFSGCGFGNQANPGPEANRLQTQNTRGDNMQTQNNDWDNNQTRMEVASEAADKITDLDDVSHANVIAANRNAYVAVVLDDDRKGEIRQELENEISEVVKSTDSNIQNVFVSANPDFVDRMTGYGDKIQEGRPIQGLFEEFTEMTQRIFPNAR
ncbi:hypothetical protein BALCAV_0221785 [Alkalihalobacillus alcalophilus ATCC 27647 = CGMCC 1.3604]|uniref:YhcN/YlaJ family sporulation lipoprotein n=1 Tax=Alkalihalobacillus alcalophilus ATCC 27647 = CGMCC 1.3604 TaxID=1218173 RepID=A0A094WI39_ALKAL|nr:hypothetical protein BALCAV_0221785 [Alkalihalobacillus alcalophilus ATCC 27647 = CGMCC 1.3604]